MVKNAIHKQERFKGSGYIIATLNQEQINALLAACDVHTAVGYRDYTILLLLLDTGMRVSELCRLQLQDIQKDHLRVLGKGRKEREVGVHPDTIEHIWMYARNFRNALHEHEQHLFLNRGGAPLTSDGVAKLIAAAAEKAHITDIHVSARTLRHTFAVMYLAQGGSVYALSRLMGYSAGLITVP